MTIITLDATRSSIVDADDCLQAAADQYIAAHPDLAGWDLSPRWADESREAIELTVPEWADGSREMPSKKFRVTGDFHRMVYSSHRTLDAARAACCKLENKWGWSHPGSEPAVERLTGSGWIRVQAWRAAAKEAAVKSDREAAEYEAHNAAVKNAMTFGGRSR